MQICDVHVKCPTINVRCRTGQNAEPKTLDVLAKPFGDSSVLRSLQRFVAFTNCQTSEV